MTTPTTPTILDRWNDLSAYNAGVALARAELRLARIIGYHPAEDHLVHVPEIDTSYCEGCDTYGDLFGCIATDEDTAIADLRAYVNAQVAANTALTDLMALPQRIAH